jgi:hypothetical protein
MGVLLVLTLMLVLKVPVQETLPEASMVVHCASAGSDSHSGNGASAEAANSQGFRGFAPTRESETRPWNDTDLPRFRIIATPIQSARPVCGEFAPHPQQVKLQLSDLRYSPMHIS